MKPLLGLLLSCLLFLPCLTHAANEKRPNILFILVDDQSPFDFKFYNPKSPLETPNIDRLAAEGMVFDGAYHMGSFSGAVCTPSRHMIMSGRTVWHLPIGPLAARTLPAGPCAEHDSRRLQSRRVRDDAHLQAGQQLRGRRTSSSPSATMPPNAAARTKRAARGTPSRCWII